MSKDQRSSAQEAIRRFESGQTDFEEIFDANGIRNFMIRDQKDPRFFRIEAEGPDKQFVVTTTGLRLPPSQDRPRELPPHLPFLPHTTTVVMIMPATGSVVVRWENPQDPAGAFQEIRDDLLGGEWEEVGSGSHPGTGSLSSSFQKDRTARTLRLFSGAERSDLVLTEERAE